MINNIGASHVPMPERTNSKTLSVGCAWYSSTVAHTGFLPSMSPASALTRIILHPVERMFIEFAIGEPEVFVEMLLSPAAFTEFCATNQVDMLPPRDPDAVPDDWDWRLADATRFK